MTPRQKLLVRTTFDHILQITDTAALLFYAKLFEVDPSVVGMFPMKIESQGRMLMLVVTRAVRGMDDLECLLPVLRELGRRHLRYGVRDEHYETVVEAMVWALQIGLHAGFTAEVREAWTAWYWLLADAMKAGAAEELLTASAS
jgi:hemoglobin-like flavoprotein